MAKQGMKRIERTHTKPSKPHSKERPISSAYSVVDTDLARDNLENDFSAADLQDL